MRKLVLFAAIVATVGFVSCKAKTAEEAPVVEAPVEVVEEVVVPADTTIQVVEEVVAPAETPAK